MVYTDNNIVMINGRISKDASLKQIKDDFGEVQFSFCSNSLSKKNGEWTAKPNFFLVKYKGKNLSKFAESLKKGKQISVEGILQQDSWESNGQKNSMTYILASKIQSYQSSQNNNTQTSNASDVSTDNFPEDNFESDYPEDIPF